nr:MAG TPA: PIH1 DOMAIN-CONTAINING PROTEIN 1, PHOSPHORYLATION [Bacteriophage sp.]DAJ07012.1 MAG TPA: PIH1 DOMAIN-CONTAINING PROTEIN 1, PHOSPHORYLATION [Caudoviricetes sp.]DAM82353.1 MAG TPA: PIH1 DOMAIN-CONTAINING PROTEIN 1, PHOSPHORYLATION [Caudoviricetes sp.]DAQ90512.1 MAG TPA: PIH1 DOMAIN-CONTAINING PROTEIN 1, PHOSPHORYLATION [Caudoviricetes sp.]
MYYRQSALRLYFINICSWVCDMFVLGWHNPEL